jgi:hypothetical protein
LVVQVDNCSIHRNVTTESLVKIWDFVSMPHPSYSPDLAPTAFYLVPTVKERLEHAGITDEDRPFEELHTILKPIPGAELKRVFEAWRERAENVHKGNGGDINE